MNRTEESSLDIVLALTTTFCIVLLDRLTKSAVSGFLNFRESLPVIKNVFHLTLYHNTGIAFGLFKDQGIVFIIIPIIAIVLLVFNIYYFHKNNEMLSRLYVFAFSLILGGAIGNLFDRIVFGYVIDFLDFRIWPIFNVADSAITIGAIIIAVKCFQLSKSGLK